MATTARRPVFLNTESVSLRSFRITTTGPPSLKAASLKVRTSLVFSRSRGRTTEKYPQPTLQDLTRAEEADLDLPSMPYSEDRQRQSRSKSRSIIRMLTTKLTPRSAASPKPPPSPNAFSKDQRDAALRERGLLPPLRPAKDLSTQEMEQDQRIPVLSLDSPTAEPRSASPSAADLVKREWEAKNHTVEEHQRQRMNSFKFGGSVEPTLPPDEPLPPLPAPEFESLSPPPRLTIKTDPSPDISPLLELSAHVQAYMFPLPPSPAASVVQFPFPPPSPSLRSVLDLPHNDDSGASTPRPLQVVTPTPSLPPAISLTPPLFSLPTESTTTEAPSETSDDPLSSAFHMRIDSFALLEESIASSIMTPSLHSTTTATSTDATSESQSPPTDTSSGSSSSKGIGKLGMLQVKTHEGGTIPVIVESPVEASLRFSEELAVVLEEEDEKPSEDADASSPIPLSPRSLTSIPESPKTAPAALSTALAPPPSPTAPRKRDPKRMMTDPEGGERRKSINPFKRTATLVVGSHGRGGDDENLAPQRRPSVATSLSNMRRSVIGTLSRPKNPLAADATGTGKWFNASQLPPSPTLPSSFNFNPARVGPSLGASASSPPASPILPRQAVSPIMYNRGSILLETAGIEDEESRRMTELAFLG